MKKFLYIAIIGILSWSCGGGDDPPTPPPNTAPTTPTTIYPANNDLCIDNAVNFRWNASTDSDSNSISYILEVSENSSFSPIAHSRTTSSTSETISLDKGVSFYWRVTAKDDEGLSSDPSSGNGFYTEGEGVTNYVPFPAELTAPELGSTVQTTTANLQWTATDVDNDPLVYDVYFDTVNPPINVVSSNQTANSFTTATLTDSSTYYWKIVVKDDKGGQTKGQVWSFKTD